ncbi:MAG: hypothetical protein ACTS6P_01620 [Candidatus Hodgkinia cicadicola]
MKIRFALRAVDEMTAGCIWTKLLIMKLNSLNIDILTRGVNLLPPLNWNFRRCNFY